MPDDAVLVIRGWDEDMRAMAADARRFLARYPEWKRFGLSAFVAASADEIDQLCDVRLERYATVRIFLRRDLLQAGVEIVPTFRTPHVTLAHPELDVLLFSLRGCDHEDVPNRHHKEAW